MPEIIQGPYCASEISSRPRVMGKSCFVWKRKFLCRIPKIRLIGYIYIYIYIQGVSRLVDITAADNFLGLSDQKSSYKHVSDFGRSRSYGHFLIPVHALL